MSTVNKKIYTKQQILAGAAIDIIRVGPSWKLACELVTSFYETAADRV